MKTKLKVAGANLILEEIELKKHGRIIVPDTAESERLMRCRVLAKGPGEIHVTESGKKVRLTVAEIAGQRINVGDEVLILKYSHTGEIDGPNGTRVKVRISKADEIKAVVS